MVRIQLDNGYLDVKEGTAFPLNFQVGDIRDLTQRKGTFSKTITLSGTKNNNTLLNNYYDVNIKAGTFDINKITKCTVLQNGIPIVTDALLQLVNVKKVQLTDAYEQGVEYEVLVRDSQAEFYTTITNKELTDLDFSDCNHDFDITSITDSWTHTQSDNYKYLMPFNDSNKYTVNHFKPAIYAKSYFDRIFSNAGFTYDWQNLASSHFDKLLIPYNGDVNNFDYSDYQVKAESVYTTNYTQPTIGTNVTFLQNVSPWTETLDAQNLLNPTTGVYVVPFNSDPTQGQTYTFNFSYAYEILLDNINAVTAYLLGAYRYNLVISISVNGINQVLAEATDKIQISGFTPPYEYTIPSGQTTILNASGTTSYPVGVRLYAGDVIRIRVGVRAFDVQGAAFKGQWSNGSGTGLRVNPQVEFSDLKVDITPSTNIQVIGGTQIVNEFIPQKIKQSDFVKAIFQMYNLYAYPDINNPNNLILVSRDEWYDAGTEKDWSSKLAKNQEQQLIFLPDLTNKKLKLTYKEDTDSPNKTYTQATSEIYGQIEYTFQNEYVKDTDVKEILFSPTPVNKTSFDAYLPMISGIAPNTNIRIVYDAGLRSCQAFNIYEQGTTGVTGLTSYPQTGHFNDAITPTFDINFGVCDYYFYQTSVLTNNNLYNLYWRRTVNQINVGRLLSASFYLNEADIQTLKLNDKIRIDNSWWNINKIMDYNANEDVLTKVELISVDTEIDLADFKTRIARPFDPNISAHGNSGVYVDNTFNSNVNLSDGNVVILGKGNTVTSGVNALIVGDDQQVTETGITTPNLRVTETINGSPISEILPTYKKYVALLSQSGTNAPTAIILENTIGDIIFNYIAVGVYEAVLVGQFLSNKTWVIGGSADISAGTGDFATLDIKRFDDDTITLTTFDNFSPSNNMLFDTSIEIRIYP
jgi:hypothetical protein